MEFFSAEEDVSQLIDTVQKHPYLYRTDDERYKDVIMKAEAWKEIGEALGKTDEACKTKWKNLRDWFVRKKKDGKLPTGSGPSSTRIRLRFKQMGFLDDVPGALLEDDTTGSTAIGINCAVETNGGDDSGSLEIDSDEDFNPTLKAVKSQQCQSSLHTSLLNIIKTSDGRITRAIRQPERQITSEDPRQTCLQNCARLDSDELDKFFLAMAASARQLPRDLQISVKEDVTRIIFAAERETNNRECSNIQSQQNSYERVKKRKHSQPSGVRPLI